ncbi:sulfite exporter TauE/SafE family protein [Hansschlegelia zhihuaiae]|uniref:sulfite exporter TauE/SafE family protein n=1 Tax=Hansschlegelia zhihuaiae TaxID=405005 RepID=UPI0013E89C5B|nr:sulfite exporter TauE/SafE family protein [Hansschlegelia zhihuaiae]
MTAAFGFPIATLTVLWAGAFIGALAAGGAGFAFALAASSIWLHSFEPIQTTALVVACGTLVQLVTFLPFRRSVDARRLSPFVIGALAGVPIGVALLSTVDAPTLKVAIGVGLTIYGAYALLAPRLPVIESGGRPADAAVAFAGGVLGGLGGYCGVLPTIWAQLRGWPKATARGVCQSYILVANFLTLALVGAIAVDDESLKLFALALPALAAGGWLGFAIYGRLDEAMFKRFLAAMLLASGVALLI